ncbi:MAG TPA: DUF262 domain-containing protein [Bacteroidales bacterium]|nr:DUF262 domain-containing protein [Bacteroidales bacterium]
MKISQIIDKIDANQLFVPAFQREFVWKRDNVKDLIYSLIREYPTGTMLTWETNNPPELKGPHKYDTKQGSVKLILDGQQRITTLYMLIKGAIPPYYTIEDIKIDPRNLYVNLQTLELEYYMPRKMDNNPIWTSITDIFHGKVNSWEVVEKINADGENRVDKEFHKKLDQHIKAIEKIKDRDFLEQEVPIKASLKEAIDIFYIVNASGVNLTEAELALAQISGYWPEARELFKKKLSELEKNGFPFKLDFVVYILLGILYHMGSDMKKLHSRDNIDKIKAVWSKLEKETLDYVLNILQTHAYIDHSKEINSVYALIPIIVFAQDKGKDRISHVEIHKMIKWFYYSQIRYRYISQLPQKLDKDLGIIEKSENPFDEMLSIIRSERPLEITKGEFIGVGVSNPLWSLMKWYFKSRNAVCFSTGIGIRKPMGKIYGLEWDHIFAYSLLKENGYNLNNRTKNALAQEITNRIVLTQTANRSKSACHADVYLKHVQELFPEALDLQCVPKDEELWTIENFERFLDARREILAGHLNKFLSSITENIEEPTVADIDELINQGESTYLEFKSSLRWDHNELCINRKLEDVVLKTLAAFNNGDGGTLLIGVSDDGDVLGLSDDYNTLDGTRDKFELHLRTLIKNAFGIDFSTRNVKVTFPRVGEEEICMIEVDMGIKPLYLIRVDKNKIKQEKFYVRSGNSSQEITAPSEIMNYINSRFNHKS